MLRHRRQRIADSRKRQAGKQLRRHHDLNFDSLEQRTLLSVRASLLDGTLSVTLDGADDAAEITGAPDGTVWVVAPDYTFASNGLPVRRLVVDGNDSDGQQVFLDGALQLPDGMQISDVATATFGSGSFQVGSAEVEAGAILVLRSIISSRQVAPGADPGSAPSRGDSGDLRFEAPLITVSDQSRILAGADAGFRAGDVILNAEETAEATWALGYNFRDVDTATGITIGAATITGGNVYIRSTASTTKSVDLSEDLAEDTRAVLTADFNGDGRPDLVTAGESSQTRLYLNNGTDRPFVGVDSIALTDPLASRALAAADVNGDGLVDLVVVGEGATAKLLLNAGGNSPFLNAQPMDVSDPVEATSVVLADLNNDGRPDLVIGRSDGPTLLYLNGGGDTPFATAPFEIPAVGTTTSLAAGDLDRDNRVDLVVGYENQPAAVFYNTLNNPPDDSGNPFAGASGVALPDDPGKTTAVAIGNVNYDGWDEILVVKDGLSPRIYSRDSSPDARSYTGLDLEGEKLHSATSVVVADVTANGVPDIVIGNLDGTTQIFQFGYNTQDGEYYNEQTADNLSSNTRAIAAADLNGDGLIDLVLGNGIEDEDSSPELNVVYINSGEPDAPFSSDEAQLVTPETQLAGETGGDNVFGFSLFAAVIRLQPSAQVLINGSTIVTSGGLVLSAQSVAEASMITLGTYIGVSYARSSPTATVDVMGGSTLLVGGLFNVLAAATNTLSMSTYVPSLGTGANLVVSYAKTDSVSRASIGAGAFVQAGSAYITARNENDLTNTATALGFQSSGPAGIGATLTIGDYTSTATASIAGTVMTSGDLSIRADSDNTSSVTRSSASVINALQDKPVLGSILTWFGGKLSQSSFSLTKSLGSRTLKGKGGAPKVAFSAAVTYVDDTNEATAEVADGAAVVAGGNVSIRAYARDNIQTSATASAGDSKKASVGGAINIADVRNLATARIGANASVDAGGSVVVDAHADSPRPIEYLGLEFSLPSSDSTESTDDITQAYDDGYSAGLFVSNIADLFKTLILTGSALSELSTTVVHSGGTTKEDGTLGIAGGVNFLWLNNEATATIDEGAQINQNLAGTVAADQTVTVSSLAEVKALNIAGQVSALNLKRAGGGSGGADYGFGGSIDVIDVENSSRSSIADGARIYAVHAVNVTSDVDNVVFTFAQAGAKADVLGVDGAINFKTLTGTSVAWIEDGAAVRAQGDVTVHADQGVFLINGAGGLAISDNAGVGISGAINDVTLTTRASIGDGNGTTPTASWTVAADGDVSVAATTDTQYWTISLAGAVAVSTEDEVDLPAVEPEDDSEIADPGQEFQVEGQEPVGGKKFGFALSGDASVNYLTQTTEAYIANSGWMLVGGDLDVRASDESLLVAGAGAWVGANKAAIGGSFGFNRLDQTVHATTSNVYLSAASLSVSAVSTPTVVTVAAGGGGSKKGGAVVGSATANLLSMDTAANLGAGTLALAPEGVMVNALASPVSWSVAGAFSLNVNGDVAVGAALALDIIKPTTIAFIGNGVVVISDGNIFVNAETDQSLYSIAASLTIAAQSGLGAGGSAAAVKTEPVTQALIGAGAQVSTLRNIGVIAHDDLTLLVIGGAAAGGKEAGVGLSVGIGMIDRTTQASILDGARVTALGRGDLLPGFDRSGLLLDARSNDDLFTFGAGIVGSQQAAVAASATVLHMTSTTEATTGGEVRINDANDGADGNQSVVLHADHQTFLLNVAGTFEGAKEFGLGGAASAVVLDRTSRTGIGADNLIVAARDVVANADADLTIWSVAAAIVATGGAGLSGSFSVLLLDDTVDAHVGERSIVGAGGNVGVLANRDSDLNAIAGAAGIGKDQGLGVSSSVILQTSTVSAYLGSDARVTARSNAPSLAITTGTKDEDGDVVTTDVRGLAIAATGYDEILSIAVGGAGAGSFSAAGSLTITDLDHTTQVYIAPRAVVNLNPSGASANQDVKLLASDRTDHTAAAGALSVAVSGGLGIGPGAEVGLIDKTTQAYIAEDAVVRALGSIELTSNSEEDILSVAAALAISGQVGIAGAASGYSLTLVTGAFIGRNAIVRAEGNVIITAYDELGLDSIAGNISGSGSASVGASVSVIVLDQTTRAYVADGARVTALGNAGSQSIASGSFQANYQSLPEDSPIVLPEVDNDDVDEPGLFGDRIATAGSLSGRGLMISATATDEVRTFAVSGQVASGLAVPIAGTVVIPVVTTQAFIGQDAMINLDNTGANANQSVYVSAQGDWYHLNVAGSGGAAAASISPGAAFTAGTFRTGAVLGERAKVRAAGDVRVMATGSEHIIAVAACLDLGGAAIVGAVAFTSVDAGTSAEIGASATVWARGNVLVSADDTTKSTMVAGAGVLTGGFGAGASVGVTNIIKSTRAFVGADAMVTAEAVSLDAIPTYTGDYFDEGFLEGSLRGVSIVASSSEDVLSVSASGQGSGYVALAGAVTLERIESVTHAYADAGAVLLASPAEPSAGGDVGVAAVNRTDVFVVDGGLSIGVGVGGLAGGVDVGIVRNDTSAWLGANSLARAAGDVSVLSMAKKSGEVYAIGVGGGLTGLSGAVALWTIGGDLSEDALGYLSSFSDEALSGAEYFDSAISSDNILGAVTGHSSDTTEGQAFRELAAASSSSLPDDTASESFADATTEASTSAYTGTSAVVEAGGDINVSAKDRIDFTSTSGAGTGGLAVGAGGAVSIVSVHARTTARIGDLTTLSAGPRGDIDVLADQLNLVDSLAYCGTATLVAGLDGQYASVEDESEVLAEIGRLDVGLREPASRASVIRADEVAITAGLTRDLFAGSEGGSGSGGFAVGLSLADVTAAGSARAGLGVGTTVGQEPAGSVNDLSIAAYSYDTADAEALTIAVAVLASGQGARSTTGVAPVVEASIARQAKVDVVEDVELTASANTQTTADTFGVPASLGLSVGGSFSILTTAPTVSAKVKEDTTTVAGGTVWLTAGAVMTDAATSEASGGGIVDGTGSYARITITPAVEASLGDRARVQAFDVRLSASTSLLSTAEAEGINAAGLSVGVSIADASVTPTVTATVGSSAEVHAINDVVLYAYGNAALGGSTSDVDAAVVARASSSNGGLIGGTGSLATLTLTPTVRAELDDYARIVAGRIVTISAQAEHHGEASANGNVFGLLAGGNTEAEVMATGSTTARVGEDARIDAVGDVAVAAGGFLRPDAIVTGGQGSAAGGAAASTDLTINNSMTTEVDSGARIASGGHLLVVADEGLASSNLVRLIVGSGATVTDADATTVVTANAQVIIDDASLTGQNVTILTSVPTNTIFAAAVSIAGGAFAVAAAEASNTTHSTAKIDIREGSEITAAGKAAFVVDQTPIVTSSAYAQGIGFLANWGAAATSDFDGYTSFSLESGAIVTASDVSVEATSRRTVTSSVATLGNSDDGTIEETDPCSVQIDGALHLVADAAASLLVNPDNSISSSGDIGATVTPDSILVDSYRAEPSSKALSLLVRSANADGLQPISGSGTVELLTRSRLLVDDRGTLPLVFQGVDLEAVASVSLKVTYDGTGSELPVVRRSESTLDVQSTASGAVRFTDNVWLASGLIRVRNEGGDILADPGIALVAGYYDLQSRVGSVGSPAAPLALQAEAGSISASAGRDIWMGFTRQPGSELVAIGDGTYRYSRNVSVSLNAGGDVIAELSGGQGTYRGLPVNALADYELASVQADGSVLIYNTSGGLKIGSVRAINGGAWLDAAGAMEARADALVQTQALTLTAIGGIGKARTPLPVQAYTVAASSTSGEISLQAQGDVVVGDTGFLSGLIAAESIHLSGGQISILADVRSTSGKVDVTSASNLRVTEWVTIASGRDLTLGAENSLRIPTYASVHSGEDLTVEAARSGQGNTVDLAGTFRAGVGRRIEVTAGKTGSQSSVLLRGDFSDNNLRLAAGAGVSSVYATSVRPGRTLNVRSDSGTQQVVIGSLGNGQPGDLSAIQGLVQVNGNRNTRLTLDDSGNTGASSGTISRGRVDGFRTGSGVQFSGLFSLNVALGSGDDSVAVTDTIDGPTGVNSGPGNDSIRVTRVRGRTTLTGGADVDTVTLEIPGRPNGGSAFANLRFDADVLEIDNSSSSASVAWSYDGTTIKAAGQAIIEVGKARDVRVLAGVGGNDSLTVDSSASAGQQVSIRKDDGGRPRVRVGENPPIAFLGQESLAVYLGSGNDTVTIDATPVGIETTVATRSGDDRVYVNAIGDPDASDNSGSSLSVLTSQGNDRIVIDNPVAGTGLTVNPGSGNNVIDVPMTGPGQDNRISLWQNDSLRVWGTGLGSDLTVTGSNRRWGALFFNQQFQPIDTERSTLGSPGRPTIPDGLLYLQGVAGGVRYTGLLSAVLLNPPQRPAGAAPPPARVGFGTGITSQPLGVVPSELSPAPVVYGQAAPSGAGSLFRKRGR